MTFRFTVLIFFFSEARARLSYVSQVDDKGKEKKPVLSTILLSHSCSDTTLLPCS